MTSQREIKFRAWDKKQNELLSWEDIRALDMSNIYPFLYMVSRDNYEVMQYTGTKDKNGTEVYEGDVLSVKDDGFPFVEEWVGVVKFITGSYLIENLEGTDGEYLFDELREIEVMGNIHQNPELLEVNLESNQI